MSAQSKVTITLGRRGQVVKNGGVSSDEMQFSGVKRPIRERLGANIEDSSLYGGKINNKRQRAGNGSGLGDGLLGNRPECHSSQRIDQNDLRLKLIRKGLPQRNSPSGIDLREKLLRTSLKSTKNTREREREREREKEREREREAEARRVVLSREREMELPSYSSYRYAKMRDELCTSNNRGYMDLSNMESSMRPSSSSYILKNDLIDGSNGVARKSIGTTLVPPPPPPPPPKLPEVHLTVDELLTSLGLEKYTILFKAEEVDMSALRQMGDGDLKELGIPMGPRKKILLAVRSNAKQKPTH